jgi:hypothetical protein
MIKSNVECQIRSWHKEHKRSFHAHKEPDGDTNFASLVVVLPQYTPWKGKSAAMRVLNSSTHHVPQEEIYESGTRRRKDIKLSSGAYMLLHIFNGRHSTLVVPIHSNQYRLGIKLSSRTICTSPLIRRPRLAHFPWQSLIQQDILCMRSSSSDFQRRILCRRVSLKPDKFLRVATDGQTGGTLGFYCRWYYSHVNEQHYQELPQSFKGIDLAFYNSVCRMTKIFGLTISIRVVMWAEIHKTTKSMKQETNGLVPTPRDEDVVPLDRVMNFLENYGCNSWREYVSFLQFGSGIFPLPC